MAAPALAAMLPAIQGAAGGGGGGGGGFFGAGGSTPSLRLSEAGPAATLAAAQGFAETTTNDQLQKLNRKRLDQLLALQSAGQLGLTGARQAQLSGQLVSPVQQAALAARQRSEQVASALGYQSGADLSRLRQEQGRETGNAAMVAAAAIAAADDAERERQKTEIEQRTALKGALRADDYASAFRAASALAAPLGQGTAARSGLGAAPTAPQTDVAAQFTPEELELLRRDPELTRSVFAELQSRAAAQAAASAAPAAPAPAAPAGGG